MAYIEWTKYRFEKPILDAEIYDYYKVNFITNKEIIFRKSCNDFFIKFRRDFLGSLFLTLIIVVLISIFSRLEQFNEFLIISILLNYLLFLLVVLFFNGFIFSTISYIYYMISFNRYHGKLKKRILSSSDYKDFILKNKGKYMLKFDYANI